MVTRPPSFPSERDSIVPRCSIIPVNIDTENSISCARLDNVPVRRTARIGCHPFIAVTLLFTIDVLEVGFDRYVGAELLEANIGQWCLPRTWHVGERNACFAGKFRSVKEHHLVHQAGGK